MQRIHRVSYLDFDLGKIAFVAGKSKFITAQTVQAGIFR